jgi:hypothetical protein
MELGSILALIAIALIIFVMFQVHTLFTRKSEPDIIVNNYIQGAEKSTESYPLRKDASSTGEVDIERLTTVRDIDGNVSLSSEKLGKSNVSETAKKIKKMRN